MLGFSWECIGISSIIVDSFYGKADLEQWLKPDILRTDYSDIITVGWINFTRGSKKKTNIESFIKPKLD